MTPLPHMKCAAVLSSCGTYRYTLERWWDRTRKPLVFFLLNPSTADASTDDRTLRRGSTSPSGRAQAASSS